MRKVSVKTIISGPKQTQFTLDMGDPQTPQHQFSIAKFFIKWDTEGKVYGTKYPVDMISNVYQCPVVPFEIALECTSDDICYILLENIMRDTCVMINALIRLFYSNSFQLIESEFIDTCWDHIQNNYPTRKGLFEIRKKVSYELYGN